MSASFFFYDLETSGLSARTSRVMQFAGQRTDADLKPIGEPVNLLIKLTPDVLPQPDAVLLTGITPQQVISDGLTEAEFMRFFYDQVVQPDTTFLGYNSVRFDDEFMRFLHYRNFYDAYEWQWADGCSRWDMLDVVRMTRALRPGDIKWPFTADRTPTNRLELLTKINKLDHYKAHDALSDVYATIDIAKLIKSSQPELFKYLFSIRKKDKVAQITDSGQPFTYTSSHFSSQYLHTTVVTMLAQSERQDSAIVYDLRFDPTKYLKMSEAELKKIWRFTKDPDADRLPVKTIKYNRCPAVAAGVVQDPASLKRLGLSLPLISKHLKILQSDQAAFSNKLKQIAASFDDQRSNEQSKEELSAMNVDSQLYDGFYDKHDKELLSAVRDTAPGDLTRGYAEKFHDARFQELLPLYKARNYPSDLTTEERTRWDEFRATKLLSGGLESELAMYFGRINKLKEQTRLSDNQKFLLEELQLYGESIVPADAND